MFSEEFDHEAIAKNTVFILSDLGSHLEWGFLLLGESDNGVHFSLEAFFLAFYYSFRRCI